MAALAISGLRVPRHLSLTVAIAAAHFGRILALVWPGLVARQGRPTSARQSVKVIAFLSSVSVGSTPGTGLLS